MIPKAAVRRRRGGNMSAAPHCYIPRKHTLNNVKILKYFISQCQHCPNIHSMQVPFMLGTA